MTQNVDDVHSYDSGFLKAMERLESAPTSHKKEFQRRSAIFFRRKRKIKDIEIIELTIDKIVADVRAYSAYIDLEKRFILHDCGDWKRTIHEKRFCKHIGALMHALPEDAARDVLLGIKRQQWEFSQYTGRGGCFMNSRKLLR